MNADLTISMRKEKRDMRNKRIRLLANYNTNTTNDTSDTTITTNDSSTPINQLHHHHDVSTAAFINGLNTDSQQQREQQLPPTDVIVRNIYDQSPATKMIGLTQLRQLTCTSDWPVDRIIATGVVDYVISLLMSSDHNIQYEAIWCLTNIASGDHHHTALILKAVPVLLQILGSTNPNLQDQASWTIGNIAGDSDEYRHVLIANGAVKPLFEYSLSSASTSLSLNHNDTTCESYYDRARTAVWALSNLTRGTTPASVFMNAGALSSLIEVMVKHPDRRLVSEICWVFTFLSAKDLESVQMLVDLGLIQALTVVVDRADPASLESVPALRCLGNLSSGSVPWIDVILNTSFFPTSLLRLLSISSTIPDYTIVLKEVLRLIANVLGGTAIHRKRLLANSMLEIVIGALTSDSFDLQREAIRGLHNACLDDDVVRLLSSQVNVLILVINLMKSPDTSMALSCMKIVRVVLVQSNDLIEACAKNGLFDILDELHYTNADDDICSTAAALSDELSELFEDTDLTTYEPANAKNVANAATDSYTFPNNNSEGMVFSFGTGTAGAAGAAGTAGGGRGRGAHLLKPAWME